MKVGGGALSGCAGAACGSDVLPPVAAVYHWVNERGGVGYWYLGAGGYVACIVGVGSLL